MSCLEPELGQASVQSVGCGCGRGSEGLRPRILLFLAGGPLFRVGGKYSHDLVAAVVADVVA